MFQFNASMTCTGKARRSIMKRTPGFFGLLLILLLASWAGYAFDKEEKRDRQKAAGADKEDRVELGKVDWMRDHQKALDRSAAQDAPVFILFTEVPGCSTVKGYGREVLSDRRIADMIEEHFVPLAIFNNKKGEDRKVLNAYDEPTWNNPAVRIVDQAREELVPRLYGDYSKEATVERIVEALRERDGKAPRYLRLYEARSVAKGREEKAILNMHCFWTGEAKAGAIEGVLNTRAGFMEGTEVVEVTYDPQRLSYESLLEKAKAKGAASGCFARTDQEARIAEKVFGQAAERSGSAFRYAEGDDDHALNGTVYEDLSLSDIQRTKVNSALAAGEDASPYIAPFQRRASR